MMNPTQKHVRISEISLPLHSIGEKSKSHKHVNIAVILISAFYDLCLIVS